jgi:hypothetical protein
MKVNSINRRQLIEEEVYDELPSPDIADKVDSDCDMKYKSFNSNEIIYLRKSKELLSVCVNCLLPVLSILTISLG